MGKIIRPEIIISGEDTKKEPKKAKTTSLPIQLNASKHRVFRVLRENNNINSCRPL